MAFGPCPFFCYCDEENGHCNCEKYRSKVQWEVGFGDVGEKRLLRRKKLVMCQKRAV